MAYITPVFHMQKVSNCHDKKMAPTYNYETVDYTYPQLYQCARRSFWRNHSSSVALGNILEALSYQITRLSKGSSNNNLATLYNYNLNLSFNQIMQLEAPPAKYRRKWLYWAIKIPLWWTSFSMESSRSSWLRA